MGELTDSQIKDIAQAQTLGGPQPGDSYEHFKGGRYTIVARSLMEDTLTPLVTYRSEAKGTYWTRTLKNFEERVLLRDVPLQDGSLGDSLVSRFRRV